MAIDTSGERAGAIGINLPGIPFALFDRALEAGIYLPAAAAGSPSSPTTGLFCGLYASLEAVVQAAYDTQFLVRLTNPGSKAATTINSAKLTLAKCSVEGDFIRVVGREFSLVLHEDVAVAIDGVIAHLVRRMGQTQENARALFEDYERRLRGISARGLPQTSSLRDPTAEPDGSRPRFDKSFFGDLNPEQRGPLFEDFERYRNG